MIQEVLAGDDIGDFVLCLGLQFRSATVATAFGMARPKMSPEQRAQQARLRQGGMKKHMACMTSRAHQARQCKEREQRERNAQKPAVFVKWS